MGLKGDLTAGEIVEQLVHAQRVTAIKNVVYMVSWSLVKQIPSVYLLLLCHDMLSPHGQAVLLSSFYAHGIQHSITTLVEAYHMLRECISPI